MTDVIDLFRVFPQDLNELAAIVRGALPKLARAVLCALITIDVHARDMVTDMVKHGVSSVTNFDWQKQLRCVTSRKLEYTPATGLI